MNELMSSIFLLANPHLDDPNFLRTVIFLCEHGETGSVGFILNRKLNHTVDEFIPELGDFPLPVYEGGPVEMNSLHFLHQYPEQISGGKEILKGVYWGGRFDELLELINSRTVDLSKIKFFLGYSGWASGQLDFEMEEQTWIITEATKKFLFYNKETELWKDVLSNMGGEYQFFTNAPVNPRLN